MVLNENKSSITVNIGRMCRCWSRWKWCCVSKVLCVFCFLWRAESTVPSVVWSVVSLRNYSSVLHMLLCHKWNSVSVTFLPANVSSLIFSFFSKSFPSFSFPFHIDCGFNIPSQTKKNKVCGSHKKLVFFFPHFPTTVRVHFLVSWQRYWSIWIALRGHL